MVTGGEKIYTKAPWEGGRGKTGAKLTSDLRGPATQGLRATGQVLACEHDAAGTGGRATGVTGAWSRGARDAPGAQLT